MSPWSSPRACGVQAFLLLRSRSPSPLPTPMVTNLEAPSAFTSSSLPASSCLPSPVSRKTLPVWRFQRGTPWRPEDGILPMLSISPLLSRAPRLGPLLLYVESILPPFPHPGGSLSWNHLCVRPRLLQSGLLRSPLPLSVI